MVTSRNDETIVIPVGPYLERSVKGALSLCLLTEIGHHSVSTYLSWLDQFIASGVTSVQFRHKTASPQMALNWANALQHFLVARSVPLIINDDIALAKSVGAAGVHLGQKDGSPHHARHTLGESAIIGLSIESEQQLLSANQLDCIDYVAASAVYPSPSKENLKKIWGIDGLRQFVQLSRHPVVAIGGIDAQNARPVVACGVAGLAVISAIHHASSPQQVVEAILAVIKGGNNE